MDNKPHYQLLDSFLIPPDFANDKAVVRRGNYVVPNEFSPGTQFDALVNAKGLMVSVGTFRTLIIYAWAQFITHLLILDYDSEVVNFNRRHFDKILLLNETFGDDLFLQRFHYICFLHGRLFRGELTTKERAATNIVMLVRNLMKNNDDRMVTKYDDDNNFEQVQFQNEVAVGMPWASSLFQYARAPENSGGYYWDNNIQWIKIIDGLKRNKIAVATADFSNNENMKALNNYIGSTNLNFALFDRSNIAYINEELRRADLILYSESIACQFHNKFEINLLFAACL